ncbi:hypothetical protein [Streptococcus intermedius]
MFNKKKRMQKAFAMIAKFIDKSNLDEQEKRNLKGLLFNIQLRNQINQLQSENRRLQTIIDSIALVFRNSGIMK